MLYIFKKTLDYEVFKQKEYYIFLDYSNDYIVEGVDNHGFNKDECVNEDELEGDPSNYRYYHCMDGCNYVSYIFTGHFHIENKKERSDQGYSTIIIDA